MREARKVALCSKAKTPKQCSEEYLAGFSLILCRKPDETTLDRIAIPSYSLISRIRREFKSFSSKLIQTREKVRARSVVRH
jgi:hypothetical protein